MTETHRYTRVAIILHWLIAFAIVGNIVGGLWMVSADPSPFVFTAFQMHKTFGLLVLILTIARIAWRVMNPPPALPAGMKGWERAAANGAHFAFYALMLLVPLSGWAMVSSAPNAIPTLLFNAIPWPNLPLPVTESLNGLLKDAHKLLAFATIGLLALHIGAALKHQFVSKDRLIARMVPGWFGKTLGPVRAGRGLMSVLALSLGLLAIGAWTGRSGPAQADAGPQTAATGQNSEAGNWEVIPEESAITFEVNYIGQPTLVVARDWTASIGFDPANLSETAITVSVPMASAEAGDNYIDGSLKGADWFDVANHPTARFVATSVERVSGDEFVLNGTVTLREITRPVSLSFFLDIDGTLATANGTATLTRSEFGLGMKDDPGFDWVGDDVRIDVVVVANAR